MPSRIGAAPGVPGSPIMAPRIICLALGLGMLCCLSPPVEPQRPHTRRTCARTAHCSTPPAQRARTCVSAWPGSTRPRPCALPCMRARCRLTRVVAASRGPHQQMLPARDSNPPRRPVVPPCSAIPPAAQTLARTAPLHMHVGDGPSFGWWPPGVPQPVRASSARVPRWTTTAASIWTRSNSTSR